MATLVLITVTIPGQEKPLATSAPAYGLAERQLPPPSQGLLNDCLRTQSETFGDWDLGGQVRVRYELKENGGINPNFDFRRAGVDNDNAYLLLREKLHLGYAPCSWFGLFAEGRDSSAIGDERHPSPDADQVDLYQAFIRVGDPKQFPLTAKIGRQELIYGDERLVGNADWNNVPRSFDAAKLRFENPNLWVDAFAGLVVVPVPHQFNEDNNHDWFSGIYASSSTLVPRQETQLYFLSRNASTKAVGAVSGSLYPLPSARDIETAGARVKSLPGQRNGWDYTAELAGQFGSINLAVPGAGRRRVDQEALAARCDRRLYLGHSPIHSATRLGIRLRFGRSRSARREKRNLRKPLSDQPQSIWVHGFFQLAQHARSASDRQPPARKTVAGDPGL